MEIILLKDIKNLGKKSEVKNVSDGFAINFLLPKKLAEKATADRIKTAENQENKAKEQAVHLRQESENLLKKLEGVRLIIKGKVSDGGKLFKGITASDIRTELRKQKNIELSEKFINFKKHIKDLGEHQVEIKVTGAGRGEITVRVEAEE